MSVQIGQVYKDNDRRAAGRTLKVVAVEVDGAVLETVTNASDIQALLDDDTPGTRSYKPVDRRGKTTKIALSRLEGNGFSLLEQPPTIVGPL